MASKQLQFFATKSDLCSLLKNVEAKISIVYFRMGHVDDPIVEPCFSLLDDPSLGTEMYPDGARKAAYIVMAASEQIVIRKIQLRAGGVTYAIDQLSNPNSVVFAPGGKVEEVGLLSGSVSTVHDSVLSLDIFAIFSKQIKKEFSRIHSSYVGSEALIALESGARLAASLRSPVEYDLVR